MLDVEKLIIEVGMMIDFLFYSERVVDVGGYSVIGVNNVFSDIDLKDLGDSLFYL